MIEIKGLTHSLGGKLVLDGIDLTVPDDTVLGIVGINGAGKSTLLRLLSGVYTPDEGSIEFDGVSPAAPKTRRNIFFLPDDPHFEANTTPDSLFAFYKTFHPGIDREVYSSLLSEYKIDMRGKLRNFSKGMRRQVFIALALAVKPGYILLDEAFDGLDPLSRKIFKDAIISLVDKGGTTVLISSHSLRELEDFCDRFILIDAQKIKQQGDIAEHVGELCKFELAFADAPKETAFASLPVVSLEVRGRFAVVILKGKSDEMRARLSALSPLIMDELELNFEEVFIHDVTEDRRDTND